MTHLRDSGALEALTPDDSGILREWTMKYVVIMNAQTSNASLHVFTSPSEVEEPEVTIPLDGCDVQISSQPNFEKCFTVITAAGLRIFLRAASISDRDSWIESIRRSKKPVTPTRKAAPMTAKKNSQDTRNSSPRRCCGHIFVFDEATKEWRQRYAYLGPGFLNLFDLPYAAPIRVLDLSHDCAIRVRGTPPCAELKVSTGEILRFMGKSDIETSEYVMGIKARASESPIPFRDFYSATSDASRFQGDEGGLSFFMRPEATAEAIAGTPVAFYIMGSLADPAPLMSEFNAVLLLDGPSERVVTTGGFAVASDNKTLILRVAYNKQGTYALQVRFRGSDIFGSPFAFRVNSGWPSAAHSLVTGSGILYAPTVGGTSAKFVVRLRDRHLNLCDQADPAKLEVRMLGAAVVASIAQVEPAAFEISYRLASGSTLAPIQIEISYGGVAVSGSPFSPSLEAPSFIVSGESGGNQMEAMSDVFDNSAAEPRVPFEPTVVTDPQIRIELEAAEAGRQVAEKAEAVSAYLSSRIRRDWALNAQDVDEVFPKGEQLELLMASSSLRSGGNEPEPSLTVSVDSGNGIARRWEPEALPPPWAPMNVVRAHVRHVRRDLHEAIHPLIDAVRTETDQGRRLEPTANWKRLLLEWPGPDRATTDLISLFRGAILTSPLQHRQLLAAMCDAVLRAEEDLHARKLLLGSANEDQAIEEDDAHRNESKGEGKEEDHSKHMLTRSNSSKGNNPREELRKRVQSLALGRSLNRPNEPLMLSNESAVRTKPSRETVLRRMGSSSNVDGEDDDEQGGESASPSVDFKVGDRVIVDGSKPGTVRHLGSTKFASGLWVGVELDDNSGRNSGMVDGIQYFICPPLHGLFVRPDRVALLGENGIHDAPRLGPGSLPHIDPRRLIDAFRTRQDNEGRVNRSGFVDALRSLDKGIPQASAEELFEVFDFDNSGQVEAREFAPGCLVMCGGEWDGKVQMAFQLLDADRSGFLDRDELEGYSLAVFRIVAHAHPEIFEDNGVDPETLARESVDSAFEFCDLNSDGRLSFEEFKEWMLTMNGQSKGHSSPPPPPPVAPSAATPSRGSIRADRTVKQPQEMKQPQEVTSSLRSTTNERTLATRSNKSHSEWREVEKWLSEDAGVVLPFELRAATEQFRNNGFTTLARVARMTAADVNRLDLSFDLRLRLITEVRNLGKKLLFDGSPGRPISMSPLA